MHRELEMVVSLLRLATSSAAVPVMLCCARKNNLLLLSHDPAPRGNRPIAGEQWPVYQHREEPASGGRWLQHAIR